MAIGMMSSLILFTVEILASSVVIDEYKYSFFFYLDIIATVSIVFDIAYLYNFLLMIFGFPDLTTETNAIPGVMYIETATAGKIEQVVKSLRLIRLIRIIKLYKYAMQALQKKDDGEEEEPDVLETEEDDPQGSVFKRETDPSKLGKALSDRNTREVIIGVLLMLMVLPLLSPTEIDYSQEYGLRELFWMGRSSCTKPQEMVDAQAALAPPSVPEGHDGYVNVQKSYNSFYCKDPLPSYCYNDAGELKDARELKPKQVDVCLPWVTPLGWAELLRMYTRASAVPESSDNTWNLIWLYIPDYLNNGQMASIPYVPAEGYTFEDMELSDKTVIGDKTWALYKYTAMQQIKGTVMQQSEDE